MKVSKTSLSVFGICLLSLAVSTILASLKVDAFKDRENYLIYAQDSIVILLRNFTEGLLPTIFNEPIWLLINIGLGLFFAPENVVRLLIFVSSFIVLSRLLFQDKNKIFILLLIFFLPIVVKNHIVHLRQGVAIAIFIFAYFSLSKYKYFYLALTPLVHSSFFVILLLMFIRASMTKIRLAGDLQSILYFVVGSVLAVLLVQVASMLGARQHEQYATAVMNNVSGLGFLFWFSVFMVYCVQGKEFLKEHSFSVGVLALYLTTYFTLPVTGRILESAVIIVLLSGTKIKGTMRSIFYALVTMFFIGQWILRLNYEGLGFYP
tara:strand:+ start:6401 stop:7360 length:960 start_codon:yes stop_codon:yes gene_type:complete